MDRCGRVAVPSDAANVWMSEMELVELFDVIVPTFCAAIRAVYNLYHQPEEAAAHHFFGLSLFSLSLQNRIFFSIGAICPLETGTTPPEDFKSCPRQGQSRRKILSLVPA